MKLTSEEERLRRESPAYRPDVGWEELERQAMNVVLSVRLDAATARRVRQVAAALGQSPGGLIRKWTMDRLGPASVEAELAAGVREGTASYDAAGDRYEALRQRYRPNRIDTLLVGESRPAGGTFFYVANSNLYYATHEAFQLGLGPMPNGEAFLDLLRERGVWLYDLADAPVDRMRGRPRRDAVRARASELVALLRESRPRLVIAVKKDLAATVRQAIEDADLDRNRLHVLPFPLYQWRTDYVRSLAALIGPQADLLRSLEDASDLAEVRAALDDPANRERIGWDELKARLEK